LIERALKRAALAKTGLPRFVSRAQYAEPLLMPAPLKGGGCLRRGLYACVFSFAAEFDAEAFARASVIDYACCYMRERAPTGAALMRRQYAKNAVTAYQDIGLRHVSKRLHARCRRCRYALEEELSAMLLMPRRESQADAGNCSCATMLRQEV